MLNTRIIMATKFGKGSNVDAIGGGDDLAARDRRAAAVEAYKNAGADVGLECWRIYDFKPHKVKRWLNRVKSGDSCVVSPILS